MDRIPRGLSEMKTSLAVLASGLVLTGSGSSGILDLTLMTPRKKDATGWLWKPQVKRSQGAKSTALHRGPLRSGQGVQESSRAMKSHCLDMCH